MIYFDLAELLPTFQKHYKGMIGIPFENELRCVPSVVYVSNLEPIEVFVDFIPERATIEVSDMETFAFFNLRYGHKYIDGLPVILPEYFERFPLSIDKVKSPTKNPAIFTSHQNDFGVLFDGAALGIYLAGWDSRYFRGAKTQPGCIDPHSIFKPSLVEIKWRRDAKMRKIPYLVFNSQEVPIVNLHITNKSRIKDFHSINWVH